MSIWKNVEQHYKQSLTLPVCSCWGAPPITSVLSDVRKCPAPTEYPVNYKCTIQYCQYHTKKKMGTWRIKAVNTTNYCKSDIQNSCKLAMKTERNVFINKRSIQTVSSSKQKQVSETLISSQDLNYLLYFKSLQNKLQTSFVNSYSTIIRWLFILQYK